MFYCHSHIHYTVLYCDGSNPLPQQNRNITTCSLPRLMLAERNFSNQLQTHVRTKCTGVYAKDSICVTFASITSMTTDFCSQDAHCHIPGSLYARLLAPEELQVIEVASIKNEGPSLMVRLDHVCYTLLALLLKLLNEYELPSREVKISPDIHWFPGFNQHMKFAGQRGIKPTNAGTSGSSCPVSRKRWKARVCT